MGDLTTNVMPAVAGPPEVCFIKEPLGPLGVNTPDPNGSTGIKVYVGAICGYNTAGKIDNIDSSTSTIVTVAGVNQVFHDGTATAVPGTTQTNLRLTKGAVSLAVDASITGTLPWGTDVYAADNQTATADPGANLVRIGYFECMDPQVSGRAYIQVGQASPLATAPGVVPESSRPYYARAVMTTVATSTTYTGTGTDTLTFGSHAAFGTQDGVTTLAVGDVVILQGGTLGSCAITAADTGPWTISVLGTSGVSAVLKRPSWWKTGAIVPAMQGIKVGPEGTLFGGTDWSSWATPGCVIGTTDPALYPDRVITQTTITNGAPQAITTVPLRSATKSYVGVSWEANTSGAQTGQVSLGQGVITPGYIGGTASVSVAALATAFGAITPTGVVTVNVLIVNR